MNVTKLKKFTKIAVGAVALLGVSSAAMAGGTTDPFVELATTVDGWAKGGLGKAICTMMVIGGGLFGLAKNSPYPMLSGVGGAAVMHYGPNIISNILGAGATIA